MAYRWQSTVDFPDTNEGGVRCVQARDTRAYAMNGAGPLRKGHRRSISHMTPSGHPRPWRAVTLIGEQTGPRGGKVWILTLECGHLAARAQPNTGPERTVRRMVQRLSRFTAPHKMRCWICKP